MATVVFSDDVQPTAWPYSVHMPAIDSLDLPPLVAIRPQSHPRQESRVRHGRPADGTYADRVAQNASSDPRVRQFAQFVKRALADAKDRGMSIEEIEDRIKEVDVEAKVGRSTIYRWRRAEVESPGRKQVFAFCDALGIPRTTAAQILGWDGEPASPEPDPSIDPDLRAVMRKLNDPNVSTEAKKTIRQMLRYLAREE